MSVQDVKYIVVFYDENGLSGARTTEGKVFVIAMPFATKTSATKYANTIEKLLDKKAILFKKVNEK